MFTKNSRAGYGVMTTTTLIPPSDDQHCR